MKNSGQFFQDQKALSNNEFLFNKVFHSSIGALVWNKKSFGTGFMVSKNIVMTAAHNVYSHESKKESQNMKFNLQIDGINKICYQVEGFRYMEAYKTCQFNEKIIYDIALLKLKDEVQLSNQFDKEINQLPKRQFLEIIPYCQKCLEQYKEQLSLFGYPIYEDNYKPNDEKRKHIKIRQYGLTESNCIKRVDQSKHLIYYMISTYPGQSGAPVVMGKKAIAVHVAGSKIQQANIGRLIDNDLVDLLKQWCKQLKGQPFSVKEEQCFHKQKVKKVVKDIIKGNEKSSKISEASQTEILLQNRIISSIDVSNSLNLLYLQLMNNQILIIDLSKNVQLIVLNVRNNHLSAIDLSNNLQLQELNIANNKIQTIDITKNQKLKYVYIFNNKLNKISLAFIAKKPIYQYCLRYDFGNQDSRNCFIELFYSKIVQAYKCKALTEKWAQNYQQENSKTNKYKCIYTFMSQQK